MIARRATKVVAWSTMPKERNARSAGFAANRTGRVLQPVCFVKLLSKGIDHSIRRLRASHAAKPPSPREGLVHGFLNANPIMGSFRMLPYERMKERPQYNARACDQRPSRWNSYWSPCFK